MSTNSNSDPAQGATRASAAADEGDKRRDDTISRIRTALIQDRLTVMSLTEENTGTDPYNSGVHRALAKTHNWRKGSR
jgi:hypothetical protein